MSQRASLWLTFSLAAGTVAVSAMPWLRAFDTGSVWFPLALAAVVSVAVPFLVSRVAHGPFSMSLAISIGLFVIAALLVVLRSLFDIGAIFEGYQDGVSTILSNRLPLTDSGAPLIPAFTLTWLVGATTGEIAVRTRSVGLTVVVPVAGFSLSLAATAGGAGTEVGWAAALLVLSGALLYLRQWQLRKPSTVVTDGSSQSSISRTLRFGAASLLGVVTLCLVVVPSLPAMQRPAVAPDREPPQVNDLVVVPLAETSTLRRNALKNDADDPVLFTIDTDRTSPGYVTIASADTYDGGIWKFQRTFLPTGGTIAPSGYSSNGREVGQHIQVEALGRVSPWMPYVERPEVVEGIPVRYDAESGMVVPGEALTPRTSYRVVSVVPNRTLEEVATDEAAVFASGLVSARSTTVPANLQEPLGKWLIQIENDGHPQEVTPAFVAALQNYFSHGRYARLDERNSDIEEPAAAAAPTTEPLPPEIPSEESAESSLPPSSTTTTPLAPRKVASTAFKDVADSINLERKATPEQYATLVALVLRQAGIPARVSTGFRLSEPGSPLDAGHYEVRGDQAWTWVEVPVAGEGWVVVDATPSNTEPGQTEEGTTTESSTTTTTTPNQVAPASAGGTAVAPPVDVADSNGSRPPIILVAVLVPVLVGLWIVFRSVLAKARRRRRRRRGSDVERAIGGWSELLDVLFEAGKTDLEARSNSEVASVVRAETGDEVGTELRTAAAIANRALFSSAGVTTLEADAVWASCRTTRQALRQQQTTTQRMRSALRVAPKQR